jgi:hypothetical protein
VRACIPNNIKAQKDFYLGLAPTGTGTIALDPTFWKFYLIRTGFTLVERVSLVKVFRLFKLDGFFGESV